jgi:hypothetical protein
MSAKDFKRYPPGILDREQYEARPRRARAMTLRELLAVEYPDPRPFDTAEAFQRQHHDDVATLSDQRLDDERLLARLRRAAEPRPSAWLTQRVARLEAEWQRRRERQEA